MNKRYIQILRALKRTVKYQGLLGGLFLKIALFQLSHHSREFVAQEFKISLLSNSLTKQSSKG